MRRRGVADFGGILSRLSRPLQGGAALLAYLRFLRAPEPVSAVELEDLLIRLASEEDKQRAMATLRSVPLIAAMLTDRYVRPQTSLSELATLPLGTLGRGYSDYLMKYKLSQDFGPEIAPQDDLLYFRLRMYQIHDFLHILTEYQADYIGECAILGFTLGHLNRYMKGKPDVMTFGTILSCTMLLHATLFANHYLTKFWSVFVEGWQRGQAASQLLHVRWEEMWEQPVVKLQERFHIVPGPIYLSHL